MQSAFIFHFLLQASESDRISIPPLETGEKDFKGAGSFHDI